MAAQRILRTPAPLEDPAPVEVGITVRDNAGVVYAYENFKVDIEAFHEVLILLAEKRRELDRQSANMTLAPARYVTPEIADIMSGARRTA